ncbi:Cyclic di-GMP phosphodiesterase response regulator RpfG [Novipirellula artificiosorum]|uniref:Cyclic di-GMP phosphodiesterase response regulator RpfG n=2 Tax=Novipirellula artificiosorum TaxID=2528016 RepID=A0A5C6D6X4_9BACT|nr:Cyclic di-GMP phosphodiesterase response regulator RpfG [Novipirellula artificiosorum]
MLLDDLTIDVASLGDGDEENTNLKSDVEHLSEALSIKFEELALIREFAERLELGEDIATTCRMLLQELAPCVQAATLAIELFADDEGAWGDEIYVSAEPIEDERIRWVAAAAYRQRERLTGESHENEITISNHLCLDGEVYNAIVVPIHRHHQRLGRMIAIRWVASGEFGTTEADLMRSTSMMLGVHLINQRQYAAMQQMFEGMIGSLVSALDAKDAYTCGHSSRVSELAVLLAKRLGYSDEDQQRIRMAGILHDIGKIGVEDSVLRKPGQLTEDEFAKIKRHPVLGYDILKGIRPFRRILPAVRHHHESWDGSGYPDGLKGEEIPRDAQVLAVADAFDAMTSSRPYRDGMPVQRVLDVFLKGRGTQWAKDVVDELLACPEVLCSV